MRPWIALLAIALGASLVAPSCFCRAEPNPEVHSRCPHCQTQEPGSGVKEPSPESPTGCPHPHCDCHRHTRADLASPGTMPALPVPLIVEVDLDLAAFMEALDPSPIQVTLESRGPPRPARLGLFLLERHLIL